MNNYPYPIITRGYLSNFLSCEERPITVDEACDIRLLLFGNTVNSFPDGWTKQGFKFKNWPSYALLQNQSGPCAVLAAVQAYIIYELLFGYARTLLEDGLLRPSVAERKEALARALGNILWQAGQEKNAVVVAMKCEHAVLDDSITASIFIGDGFLEYVKLRYFRSIDLLIGHLYKFIQDAIKDGGCILFLYSIILTHGIDKIKEEMDDPTSHLIGTDGYCSQEVVNLILIGKAVPNLFDGNFELNSGGEESTLYRGIPHQSRIGALSVYEYTNSYRVGSYYKNPKYPIWIIIGKNHYSVLFGLKRNIFEIIDKKFKLYYIDCLVKQKIEATYTIDPMAILERDHDDSLSEPRRCILTRWPFAEIDVKYSNKEDDRESE